MLRTLGLAYTMKCNAECDMCCFSCGPKRKEKMKIEEAFRYIKEASFIKDIKTIGLTGGECCLYYDEILDVIKYAKSFDFYVTLTTNGFWASSMEKTLEMMKELKQAGLIKMSVSCDEFHQEFIPIENIKNILLCSKEVGIGIELAGIVTKNSRGLEKILLQLGDAALNIRLLEGPCLPVGRAKNMAADEFIYQKQIYDKKCKNINTLAILPNGDSYPCCSQSGMTPALYLGNAKEMSINELIEKYKQNMHCKILEKKGLDWYLDIIKDKGISFDLKDEYVNICDLCHTVLQNEENLKYFKEELLDEKRKLVAEILKKKEFLRENG